MFEEHYPEHLYKKSFFTRKNFFIGLVVGFVLGGGIFSAYSVISISEDVYPDKTVTEVLGEFGQLLIAGDRPVEGEGSGVVNVLLLGVGGNGYYGTILTDTIIIASIHPGEEGEDTSVTLLSVPRDLWVEVPGVPGFRKINEAYKWGELREEGSGAEVLSEVLEKWTGVQIDYYLVGNFDAFKDAIDIVGGVDVYVDNAFTDYTYPDYNKGYLPPVVFEVGWEHMEGERALQYARSRHGNNGEGSDFARSRRQQKILIALKEKLRELNYVIDLSIIKKLAQSLVGNFGTDMQAWEMKRVYDLTKAVPDENIVTVNFDPRTTGMLCSGIDEQTQLYAIKLCDGYEFSDLHNFVQKKFSAKN